MIIFTVMTWKTMMNWKTMKNLKKMMIWKILMILEATITCSDDHYEVMTILNYRDSKETCMLIHNPS